ncbi:MAG TPA: 5-formyltetrahydrofolate cyclo-ligase [Bryobacteraceae bacterium]|nr:5-formyltetrahydrofolate cyclo-ligase [Bryobacteraceae bacterium]
MRTGKSSASLKAEIRAQALQRRDALPLSVRRNSGNAILSRILAMDELRGARTILAYCSIGSEIDTTPLLNAVLGGGRTLVLPKLNAGGGGLDLYRVKNLGGDLRPGAWGIREPDSSLCEPCPAADIELILVPGVAFDRRGARLGYGKGYYDKLLASMHPRPRTVAAAFDVQVVDAIPMEPHDVPVDTVVTETSEWWPASR